MRDLSLNTILGTPFLEQLQSILDLGNQTLNLKLIRIAIPLVAQDSGLGYKGVVEQLLSNLNVFPSIPSNFPSFVPIM